MKILWISQSLPYPPKGGVSQRSYNLIKEVSKRHNIYLVALNHEEKKDVNDAIKNLRQICGEVEIINFPLRKSDRFRKAFSSAGSITPYTARWLRNEEFRVLIRKFTHNFNIDLVHFDSIDVAEYMKEIGNLPKVLNHHNIESQMMFRRSLKETNLLKKIYFFLEALKLRRFEKTVCPLFNCNLTVSALDKERLLKNLKNTRIEVIPNGVDVSYFRPGFDDAEPQSLIFAGGMEWYPNRDAMLFFCRRIWPLLKKRIPGTKMTVIGLNPPSYATEISEKDPNLIVTGFVEDVRPYIGKAAVYVCPIRDGGGTKLKILDALAMGKPIVAHPISLEGIDVERGKHILVARTPKEFVDQIVRLFDNYSLRRELSEEGRKLVVEKYCFEKIGSRLSEIYDDIKKEVIQAKYI